MHLAFSPRATADLEDIAFHIALDSPPRAESFVAEIEAHCARIARHPRAYPRRDEFGAGVHLCVHGRHLILFRIAESAVRIERVIHGGRSIGPLG